MSVAILDDYRDRLGRLPADRFIGQLVWFTITGEVDYSSGKRITAPVRITRDKLEQWFTELGLDTKFLPPEIAKINAFRKASTDVSGTKYDLPSEGQFAELLVREVTVEPEFVLRHIMREVRDTRGRKLSYDKVGELKFFRGARTAAGKRPSGEHYKHAVRFNLDKIDQEQVEGLISKFDGLYSDLAINLSSQAIRGVIRSYLTVGLNAISAKPSGGVYFTHHTKQAQVDALHTLVQRIGQGCTFHQVPLLDTEEQRGMLTEAFQSEVEDDCRLLLEEIVKLNEKTKGGKITAKQYAAMKDRLDTVMERSEEYTKILGLQQGRAAAALEVALESIDDLADRIDFRS